MNDLLRKEARAADSMVKPIAREFFIEVRVAGKERAVGDEEYTQRKPGQHRGGCLFVRNGA